MKMRRMLAVTMLLAGSLILLYPFLADQWNLRGQARQIKAYQRQVRRLSEEESRAIWEEACQYNSGEGNLGYEAMLDPLGTGCMGILDIPALQCTLPIWQGTWEEALEKGVGHVSWSSLPTGGEGTHCVLSGHRGLPTAKLFRDLDKLALGDLFSLTVLQEKLTYQVDRITVVEPWEVAELSAVEGEDYCTLVTCTPYGINSHRLLVRGRRVTLS